jgi:probable phosphoglycerate mutase
MRAASLAICALVCLPGRVLCTDTGSPHATVILVRHAEKESDTRDPALSPSGRQRAESLAHALSGVGLRHVLSTDYRRTRETAGPVARAFGLEVEIYDPEDLEGLVERLARAEGPALVVGHSDTTGTVVALLGGDPGPPFDEELDYDRLYVVTPGAEGPTTLLLRYGAPTGESPRLTPR